MPTKFNSAQETPTNKEKEVKKEMDKPKPVYYKPIVIDGPHGSEISINLVKRFSNKTGKAFYGADAIMDATRIDGNPIECLGVMTVRGFTINFSGENEDQISVYAPKGWDKKPIIDGGIFHQIMAAVQVAAIAVSRVNVPERDVIRAELSEAEGKYRVRMAFNDGMEAMRQKVRRKTFRLRNHISEDEVESRLESISNLVLDVIIGERSDDEDSSGSAELPDMPV